MNPGGKRVLIIGATSAIAQAVARLFAGDDARLFLVARDPRRLEAVADDLRVRGAVEVLIASLDVLEYARHPEVIGRAFADLGGLDVVLIAHGTLPDQKACEASFETTREALEVNALSVISLLTELANRMQARGSGLIAVLSSPAGDRGRASNYVYGAAKGAISVFLQGLRIRMDRAGVGVLTIKPGFVDTPMTRDFEKGPLWTQPEAVARGIYRSIARGRNVVYVPWFWRWIMLIIRLIPEAVFKRLNL